ncbi:MAG: hypothetical protein INQ03_11300 [Candidatus Heimdallarchaeota archaeon]|nr:hypothetical protein [Candidatus Heimdallarchaeota archaeon]
MNSLILQKLESDQDMRNQNIEDLNVIDFFNKYIHFKRKKTMKNIERKHINHLFNHVAYFGYILADDGPDQVFSDFSNTPLNEEQVNHTIMLAGISNMVCTSQGNDYSEGIFELPSALLPDYKCMVISFKTNNHRSQDTRLRSNSLFQLNIYFPKLILKKFPSISVYEEEIIEILRFRYQDVSQLSDGILMIKIILKILMQYI